MLNYHKLNFFSVFLFLIWGITNAIAGPRDFLQAQQIAQQKAAALGANISSEGIQQAKAKVQEKVTAQRTPPYYIFNFADHAGYAIVGGDDRMPAIVGYSDRGSLNTDSLPENLKSFLAAYKATVEAVEKGDSSAVKNVEAAMKRVAGSYTPIAPLLDGIVWGQNSPFNDLCPKYDGVNAAATGCVATAMAQIMRYWKYPSSLLEDIPAYTSQGYDIPIESIPKGIGYDWDNMLENYNDGYTPAQAIAVSTLMQHIGASVKMQYGSSSGASIEPVVPALTQYFGYDKNIIKFLGRDNFEWEDWNKILQDELDKKRPIFYAGNSSYEGHAFVCDGMDADGYYHINWGWNGMSNDYFDITILNPEKKEEGTSASLNGYNIDNSAIVGIVPNDAQDKKPSFVYDRLLTSNLGIACPRERQSASDSFSGTAYYLFTSLDQDRQVMVTIGIKDKNGNVVPISSERRSIYLQKDESQNIDITFDYVLPVGEYEIYAIQSTDNGDTWKCCYGKNRMVYVNDTELFCDIFRQVTVDGIGYSVDIFHKKASVISFSGDKSEVVIPSSITYMGKINDVTKIDPNSFCMCSSLQKIDIPEGVIELGANCFYGCFSLASISLPNTLKTIGDGCFMHCLSFQKLDIPEGVVELGRNCFFDCSSLTNIILPNTLRIIGRECFTRCSSLQKIDIPEGVVRLGDTCFNGCSALKSISLPNTLKTIGDYCFSVCTSLLEIDIPAGVVEIGDNCFVDCSNLRKIDLHEGTEKIGNDCFLCCSSLTSISLPNTLRTIGEACFFECSSLQKIDIPEGVTELPDKCFNGSSALTSISLPNTLQTIGDGCFEGCSSLTNISLPSSIRKLGKQSFSGCRSWKENVVVPEGVPVIPDRCFEGCSSLTSISLPSTIRELGEYSFCYCRSWKGNVVIPEGVTVIPYGCFSSCNSITSISLPSTIRELGEFSFSDCSSWRGDVAMPEGVAVIPRCCFSGCSSLTSINLPSTIRELGKQSFMDCHSLKGDVVIPKGVTELPDDCFEYCDSLTNISLPNTLKTIGDYCFYQCSSLQKIDIPEGVTELGKLCFFACYALASISLPSTIRELGRSCFSHCYSWKGGVVIPEGVTVIPYGCFLSCNSLTSISFPSTIRELGQYSFSGCCSWKGDVVIPEGVTVIPERCFEDCWGLTSISLPSTIQKLSSDFLDDLKTTLKQLQIKSCNVLNDFEEAMSRALKSNRDYSNTTLYVPASSVEAYKQAVGQYFKEVLPLTETGVNLPNLDGMTISAKQGSIMISGLKDGTQVRLYAVDGKYIGESIASQGRVSFCCQEPMVIAKVGNKTLKIAVK